MKALIKFLLLAVATTSVLLACAKKDNSGDPIYPGYPGYPGYPIYPNGYGYPHAYKGASQILNPGLYNRYLTGQFCIHNPCQAFGGAPTIELQVSDLTFAQPVINAKLIIYVRAGYPMISSPYMKEELRVQLRRINNNTQFEGVAIDPMTGNGFGALMQIRGSGLPTAVNNGTAIPVEILYSGQTMLRAALTRIR